MSSEPRVCYQERLGTRRATAESAEHTVRRFTTARLAAFVVAAAATWFVLATPGWSPAWLGLLAAGFAALVVGHHGARRAHLRAQRAVRFYERGLARMDGTFAGSGRSGDEFRSDDHAYS